MARSKTSGGKVKKRRTQDLQINNLAFPSETLRKKAKEQAALGALGVGFGAVTHQTLKSKMGGHSTPLALQVGSAMGAAAVGGSGIGATLAAGGAVVTAKVAAGIALATAAAPVVLGASAIGAIGYGVFKLFKSK